MNSFSRALIDYERNYQTESPCFDEIEEMANEYDDAMCALADEAYEDSKCGV